nr:MAG TPA: hypothetical protein [Caudoviricetes sp.]
MTFCQHSYIISYIYFLVNLRASMLLTNSCIL